VVLEVGFSSNHSWGEAIQAGFTAAWEQVKLIAQLPSMIAKGLFDPATERPVGPVGILDVTEQIVGSARETNRWAIILDWGGAINLALAIGNLLPIPGLDGGRLLFILIEAIRRRRLNPQLERTINATAILLLLSLMAFITYLDIFYPVLPR
jgi:regulator of sigma E protease